MRALPHISVLPKFYVDIQNSNSLYFTLTFRILKHDWAISFTGKVK